MNIFAGQLYERIKIKWLFVCVVIFLQNFKYVVVNRSHSEACSLKKMHTSCFIF